MKELTVRLCDAGRVKTENTTKMRNKEINNLTKIEKKTLLITH